MPNHAIRIRRPRLEWRLLFTLFFSCVPGPAPAAPLVPQWRANGIPVKPSSSSVSLAIPIADDLGGLFVVWLDQAPGEGSAHVRATHLFPDGSRDPRWPADGIRMGDYSGEWFAHTDRSGGIYVLVAAGGVRRMTRVHEDGAIDSAWGAEGGRSLASFPGQIYAVDLSGGVWCAQAYATQTCIPDFPGHCFYGWGLQVGRLAPDGTAVTGWEAPGKRFNLSNGQLLSAQFSGFSASGDAVRFQIRYLALFGTALNPGCWVYELRSDGIGSSLLSTFLGTEFGVAAFGSDDSGREYLAACDYQNPLVMDRWAVGAHWDPPFTMSVSPFRNPLPIAISPDGSGGAYLAYTDLSGPAATRSLTRVTPSGVPDARWPTTGKSLEATAPGTVAEQRFLTDHRGGCVVTWQDSRESGDMDVYALRFAEDGSIPEGWLASGHPVAQVSGSSQSSPYSTADRFGNVFVVWRDERDGGSNAFAQRFSDAVPVAAQVQRAEARWFAGQVELQWALASEPVADMVVQRGSDAEGWELLGALVEGRSRDIWRFTDHHPPTQRLLTYRLHEPRSGWTGGEVSLAVRQDGLRIHGPDPNPWVLSSRFTLHSERSGKILLSVVDLQGRALATREFASGLADEPFAWPELSALRAGLYWLRAEQGPHSTATRFVVTR